MVKTKLISIFLLLVFSALIIAFLLASGYLKAQDSGSFPMRITEVGDANFKTGDVIFTRGKSIRSKLQQFVFGSYVNHCALLYVADDGDVWVWDTSSSVGAYMCPLDTWLEANWSGRAALPQSPPIGLRVPYIAPLETHAQPYLQRKSQLFVRRLLVPLTEEQQKKVLRFIQLNLGRPYSLRLWKRAWEVAGGDLLMLPVPDSLLPDAKGLFCSELVARSLEAAGCLHPHDARNIMPEDVWQGLLPWKSQGFGAPERLTVKGALAVRKRDWRDLLKNDMTDVSPWIRGASA